MGEEDVNIPLLVDCHRNLKRVGDTPSLQLESKKLLIAVMPLDPGLFGV